MPPRIKTQLPRQRAHIREWRAKAGISQDKLLERLREITGEFSKTSLSRLENGKQEWTESTLAALAMALGAPDGESLLRLPDAPESELLAFFKSLNEAEKLTVVRMVKAAVERAA